MPAITLRRDGGALAKKPFSWSYSKFKNYETCPLRHLKTDIEKNYVEQSEALDWGDRVHKAASAYLMTGAALPSDMEALLGPWMVKIKTGPGHILAEQKFALTKELRPTTYFNNQAWFRGVADVLKLLPQVAYAADWKTGKLTEDSVQLALMAACVFAHHPEIMKIRTEFIWLQEDAVTREDFIRQDIPTIWKNLQPRIQKMESSFNSNSYVPKPSRLCAAYCKVTSCEHHGKRY